MGEDWRKYCVPDFVKVPQLKSPLELVPLPKAALGWIRRQWTLRPRINERLCTECGICEEGCPVKPAAIHPGEGKKVEDARCIRCYCCHEFCPSHAIALQKPWLIEHVPIERLAEQGRRAVGALVKLKAWVRK